MQSATVSRFGSWTMSKVGKSREIFALFPARYVRFLRLIYGGNGSSIMTSKTSLPQDIFVKAMIGMYSNTQLNRNVV